jgi:hypothetical protein
VDDWVEPRGEEHEEFIFVDNQPSKFPEKHGKSFDQAQQGRISKYVDTSSGLEDLSGNMEHPAFRRGVPIEVPDTSSPPPKDVSSLYSHYSQVCVSFFSLPLLITHSSHPRIVGNFTLRSQ